ncbi:restriction endonuclease subunit S, partial [Mycoplasma procyoni]|uniref:restriction endonuclease subunit S n=1 Tax=Mycoplasma procyoni TaxID=568784 RepID=UPI00197B6CB9
MFKVTRGLVLATAKVKPFAFGDFIYPVYSSQTTNKGLMGYYNEFLFEDSITWSTDGYAGDVNFRKGKFYSTNVSGVLLNQNNYSNLCIATILNNEAWKHVSTAGIPKLMNNVMAKIRIVIPIEPEEQQKISLLIDKINHLRSLLERKQKRIFVKNTDFFCLTSKKDNKNTKNLLLTLFYLFCYKRVSKNELINLKNMKIMCFTYAWELKSLENLTEITSGEFVIKTKQKENGKYPVFNGGISNTG